MTQAATSTRNASPFSRLTIFGVIFVGFIAFIAMLYFLSAGDTGGNARKGEAHATSTGLNGYAGLARMLEKQGYEVNLSREQSNLETRDLLILTPPLNADADEIAQILENREYFGPTLIIVPKWLAGEPPDDLPDEDAEKFEDGWVVLGPPIGPQWTEDLPDPFAFEHDADTNAKGDLSSWSGFDKSGKLPSASVASSPAKPTHEALITDEAGRTLAFNVLGEEGTDYYEEAHWTIVVVEPDLMNNFGLSDPVRAQAALALVQEAGYGGDYDAITFDLTLNGFGGAENLLTLAFRPPFLAATLCLILAMLIIGWRAFLRFGPATASGPEIAFGKKQLVRNGAGLIVRGKRFGLLSEPYAALSDRRIAQRLGLTRHEPEAIDAALAARLPDEEPYSLRAARLRDAQSPTDILRAAQALRELEGKLAK